MADGTIATDQPREMAQVVVLLANLWVAPMFQPLTADELEARMRFYLGLLKAMGADLSAENVADRVESFRQAREEAAGSCGGATDASEGESATGSPSGADRRSGADA